jgi:hypothetical protein
MVCKHIDREGKEEGMHEVGMNEGRKKDRKSIEYKPINKKNSCCTVVVSYWTGVEMKVK